MVDTRKLANQSAAAAMPSPNGQPQAKPRRGWVTEATIQEQYKLDATVNTQGIMNINPLVFDDAQAYYGGSWQMYRVAWDEETGDVIVAMVRADEPKAKQLQIHKSGNTASARIKTGLNQLKIKIPAGRVARVPVEITTDPDFGKCIKLSFQAPVYEARTDNGNKQQKGEGTK